MQTYGTQTPKPSSEPQPPTTDVVSSKLIRPHLGLFCSCTLYVDVPNKTIDWSIDWVQQLAYLISIPCAYLCHIYTEIGTVSLPSAFLPNCAVTVFQLSVFNQSTSDLSKIVLQQNDRNVFQVTSTVFHLISKFHQNLPVTIWVNNFWGYTANRLTHTAVKTVPPPKVADVTNCILVLVVVNSMMLMTDCSWSIMGTSLPHQNGHGYRCQMFLSKTLAKFVDLLYRSK